MNAQGVQCSVKLTTQADTSQKRIGFDFETKGVPTGQQYRITINGGSALKGPPFPGSNYTNFTLTQTGDSEGRITVNNVISTGQFHSIPTTQTNAAAGEAFKEGQYTVALHYNTGTGGSTIGPKICESIFSVQTTVTNATGCTVAFPNAPDWKPDTDIRVQLTWKEAGNPGDRHAVWVKKNTETEDFAPGTGYACYTKSELVNTVNLGRFVVGDYFVDIRNECFDGVADPRKFRSETRACAASFSIRIAGGGQLPIFGDGKIVLPPCGTQLSSAECNTAIGKLKVGSIQSIVSQFFTIILGIAGISAIFLLVYAGYQLMTSGGDKQKVANAREIITAAIVGLLFIIFSIAILGFIGVEILQIPGFG